MCVFVERRWGLGARYQAPNKLGAGSGSGGGGGGGVGGRREVPVGGARGRSEISVGGRPCVLAALSAHTRGPPNLSPRASAPIPPSPHTCASLVLALLGLVWAIYEFTTPPLSNHLCNSPLPHRTCPRGRWSRTLSYPPHATAAAATWSTSIAATWATATTSSATGG